MHVSKAVFSKISIPYVRHRYQLRGPALKIKTLAGTWSGSGVNQIKSWSEDSSSTAGVRHTIEIPGPGSRWAMLMFDNLCFWLDKLPPNVDNGKPIGHQSFVRRPEGDQDLSQMVSPPWHGLAYTFLVRWGELSEGLPSVVPITNSF